MFFPVVLFLGKGCSGLSGRDGSLQPCVEKFFRGREKSCFFRVAGVCPWPVKHVPCWPKGGIPGRLRFFCLCRAGVYGLFLDVRRVGGWRLFHGQGSGTAPGRLTEGRFRVGDFRDVSICPIFWSYLPHISGRLFFIFVAQELKPCLWDLRTKKSGAHVCGVRKERNKQYEKTYPVVCCVAVVSMPLQGTGAI